MRRLMSVFVGCIPLLLAGAAAQAADFPDRPVQIIVGASAGGGTDALSRLMAQKLTEKWGKPVVVVNWPGADFRIAAESVASAKPDGTTILMNVSDLVLPNPPGVTVTYDLVKSFTEVALLARAPYCLAVRASFPANSLKDVLAMAKAQPNKVNFAVVGTGSLAEAGWRRLLVLTQTPMEFIHYQGSAPEMTALMGGEVQATSLPCLNVAPHVANGELKVLAMSQKVDLPALAAVPTFEEATGLQGYDGGGAVWYGLAVPSGTPAAVVATIRRDSIAAVRSPDLTKYLVSQLIFPAVDASQEDFTRLVQSDIARWVAWSKATDALAGKP